MTETKNKIHVLLIDDDISILNVGEIYLRKDGDLEVTTASSALSALDLIFETSFDAIVSDYSMPDMTGIELLSLLKSKGKTTPFIFFTGRGREEVVIEALNKGADFYIQKTGDPKAEFAELINDIRYAVSRKRSEKELEKALTNLKRSQEIAHIGNWSYDLVTQIFSGSEETMRILGLPPDYQPTIKEVGSMIHPDDRTFAYNSLLHVIETGEPYNMDVRISRFDTGETVYVQSHGYLWNTGNNGTSKVFGTVLDISDRKRIEKALSETNSFLENLIDIASVPIIIMDPKLNITRINKSGEELIGLSADQVLGRSISIIFPPEKIEEYSSYLSPTISRSPGVKAIKLNILHNDGSLKTVLWNSSTLYDKDGKNPIATISQGMDITESIKFEKQRNETQEQIQKNLAQLSILNDGIRNPLMAISGYAELFADKYIAEKILYQVNIIDEMVAHIDRRWAMSEKILNFLRKHCEVDPSSGSDLNK